MPWSSDRGSLSGASACNPILKSDRRSFQKARSFGDAKCCLGLSFGGDGAIVRAFTIERIHHQKGTVGHVAINRRLVSVVDDDVSVRESLPDLLRHFGFDTQTFPSAEAFLGCDAVAQTSCLILDVGLPGLNGPDLHRELLRQGHRIPTIFITAQGDRSWSHVHSGRGGRLSVQAVRRHGPVRCAYGRWEEVMMLSAPSGRMNVVATPNATATVFVVDDDVSVRESLELLISAAGWQPLTFESAKEFLAHPRHFGACCLILDVALPGLNGLELQEQIRERTDMPIIFITGHGDIPMSVRAMKAGAVEFLTKPFNDDVLLRTIQHCVDRSRAVLREQAEMRVLRGRYESLTPREREVMALVVTGLLNKQVGGELGISEITVKAHRGQLMRKMQADSLASLVTMTARLKLRTEEQI